ncbi:hypothetical protein HMPREF0682_2471 [Propionibacterium acidifaciens F0233]|uniref:Uncharacterized protein n=1 Tax=Propionibacterium acidifaciens F0233 TaxID=553198 RepID=U2RVB2_9ACTN|nr:hypothetical protein HMPREF0682_2471 [Propionibacterium acidifaciens F0233]
MPPSLVLRVEGVEGLARALPLTGAHRRRPFRNVLTAAASASSAPAAETVAKMTLMTPPPRARGRCR